MVKARVRVGAFGPPRSQPRCEGATTTFNIDIYNKYNIYWFISSSTLYMYIISTDSHIKTHMFIHFHKI